MNFYTFRTLITILIFIIVVLIYKFFIKKKSKNTNRIKVLILLIIYIIIWEFPFERFIMKFDTVEDAFNYYFPSDKIIKQYVYDDYAYVLCGKSNTFNYYVKSNSSWGFDNPFKRGYGKLKTINGYFIQINEIKGKNVTGIAVIYPNFINNDVVVNDSLSSSFDKVVYDKDKEYVTYAYIAIIDAKLDNNYTLNINGQDYKVLDD